MGDRGSCGPGTKARTGGSQGTGSRGTPRTGTRSTPGANAQGGQRPRHRPRAKNVGRGAGPPSASRWTEELGLWSRSGGPVRLSVSEGETYLGLRESGDFPLCVTARPHPVGRGQSSPLPQIPVRSGRDTAVAHHDGSDATASRGYCYRPHLSPTGPPVGEFVSAAPREGLRTSMPLIIEGPATSGWTGVTPRAADAVGAYSFIVLPSTMLTGLKLTAPEIPAAARQGRSSCCTGFPFHSGQLAPGSPPGPPPSAPPSSSSAFPSAIPRIALRPTAPPARPVSPPPSEPMQPAGQIKNLLHQLGTRQKTSELQERLQQLQYYTNQLAKETNRHLKELGQQKLQKERLMSDFSAALNNFQVVQRRAAEKEKESVARARAGSRVMGDGGSVNEQLVTFEKEDEWGQTQTEEPTITEEDLDIIKERETNIKQLEANIMDVNQIFKDLAVMIHDQGEMIDTIEANVESAEVHVDRGAVQLQKAAYYKNPKYWGPGSLRNWGPGNPEGNLGGNPEGNQDQRDPGNWVGGTGSRRTPGTGARGTLKRTPATNVGGTTGTSAKEKQGARRQLRVRDADRLLRASDAGCQLG
ncbi:hypothetical protein FQN60_016733, partial [Etheostoma spectabile]